MHVCAQDIYILRRQQCSSNGFCTYCHFPLRGTKRKSSHLSMPASSSKPPITSSPSPAALTSATLGIRNERENCKEFGDLYLVEHSFWCLFVANIYSFLGRPKVLKILRYYVVVCCLRLTPNADL